MANPDGSFMEVVFYLWYQKKVVLVLKYLKKSCAPVGVSAVDVVSPVGRELVVAKKAWLWVKYSKI